MSASPRVSTTIASRSLPSPAAGGVAANIRIRTALTDLATREGFRFVAPPVKLCGDNAAMIAWAGIEHLKRGHTHGLDTAARPRWPLAERERVT